MTPDRLEVLGNAIGLLVLIWKTGYDLAWNPRVMKLELQKHDALVAARRKRERSDRTTALAFLGLAVAQVLLLLKDLI